MTKLAQPPPVRELISINQTPAEGADVLNGLIDEFVYCHHLTECTVTNLSRIFSGLKE